MHFSAYLPEIFDEEDDELILSNYLRDSNEIYSQISKNHVKKFIYMFFDTYIGEGSQILGDVVLDIEVIDKILSRKCVEKLKKKGLFSFEKNFTLKDFVIDHLKSMRSAMKLFSEIHTFHAISMKNSENKRKNVIFGNFELALTFCKVLNDKKNEKIKIY